MENYFWVATQSCVYDLYLQPNNVYSLVHRGLTIDVLALAGPNRKETEVGEKSVTCLVKAIMARAFEISLLVEQLASLHMEGIWFTTAKSLIGNVPQSRCEISPCPLCPSQEIGDLSESDCHLSYRVQVDVSDCSFEDIYTLQLALADLKTPVTALGRACGSEKYALIGVPDCFSQETQSPPNDIWARILSLLSRLGVKDLTTLLERSSVFVWDLVECPVHRGFGDATVIDLAEEYCECPVCCEARRERIFSSLLEERVGELTDCLADESIHRCWQVGDTSNSDVDPKLPHWFKLHPRAVGNETDTFPTLESLKLRAVKTYAELEDFRGLLTEHLRRAQISTAEMRTLPQNILLRETERILLRTSKHNAPIAAALLHGNPLTLCMNTFHAQHFSTLAKSRVEMLRATRDGRDWHFFPARGK